MITPLKAKATIKILADFLTFFMGLCFYKQTNSLGSSKIMRSELNY